MKSEQEKVAEFLGKHEMDATAAFRLIDVFAELGEIASEAAKSSAYGLEEHDMEISEDEFGDALFSLLSLAEATDIDAEKALEGSLEKYRSRIDEKGDPGSGE